MSSDRASSSLRRGYGDSDGASALATLDVWDAQLARLGAQVIEVALGHLRPGLYVPDVFRNEDHQDWQRHGQRRALEFRGLDLHQSLRG